MYTTIAESNNFIVLDNFTRYDEANEVSPVYQTEAALEREFIQDLINQGYENPSGLNTREAMLANVRVQLQSLNQVTFADTEWARFVEEYLDKPSDNLVDKARKIHDNYTSRGQVFSMRKQLEIMGQSGFEFCFSWFSVKAV